MRSSLSVSPMAMPNSCGGGREVTALSAVAVDGRLKQSMAVGNITERTSTADLVYGSVRSTGDVLPKK